jgi:hypothetical protein
MTRITGNTNTTTTTKLLNLNNNLQYQHSPLMLQFLLHVML